jgi:hypothetical protein
MTHNRTDSKSPADLAAVSSTSAAPNSASSRMSDGFSPSGAPTAEDPLAKLPWRLDGHKGLRYIARRQDRSRTSSSR